MFDSLSGKLQNAFRNLRGLGKISESNVADSLREVRMALLDADVNFKVARDFIERCASRSSASGEDYKIRCAGTAARPCRDVLLEELATFEKAKDGS